MAWSIPYSRDHLLIRDDVLERRRQEEIRDQKAADDLDLLYYDSFQVMTLKRSTVDISLTTLQHTHIHTHTCSAEPLTYQSRWMEPLGFR